MNLPKNFSIPNSQVIVKECTYTDEDGNEKREVHLVIDLKPDDSEDLSLIVRYPDAEWLASLIEILTFYYKGIYPDAEPLELDLSEDAFALRYEVSDERKV